MFKDKDDYSALSLMENINMNVDNQPKLYNLLDSKSATAQPNINFLPQRTTIFAEKNSASTSGVVIT